MLIDELNSGERFLVEKVDAPQNIIDILKTIGIEVGTELDVISKGYVNGSVIVACKKYLLQLNPYFITIIHGSLVNTIEKSK